VIAGHLLRALLKFLDTIGCDYRVTQATWEHNKRNCLRVNVSRSLQAAEPRRNVGAVRLLGEAAWWCTP